MFAVIFEVKPDAARESDYLRIAASLRQELASMPGFLQNERFRSRRRSGYLLSLSLWQDEKALIRWRTAAHHHQAQAEGRCGVLDDYRIRVAEVTRITHRHVEATRQDRTEISNAVALTWVDGVLPEASLLRRHMDDASHHAPPLEDAFDHLSTRERCAVLCSWSSMDEANCFANEAMQRNDTGADIYVMQVIRDYGKTDRREAPQYFPAM